MAGANDRGNGAGDRPVVRRTSTRSLLSGESKTVAAPGSGSPRPTGTRAPGGRRAPAKKKRFIDYPRARYRGFRRWVPSWRLVTGGVLGMIFVGIGALVAAYATTTIPQPDQFAQAQTSTVYYADGKTVMGTFATQKRIIVDYSTLPDWVGKAVVASEDSSFYTNRGIDPKGIVRAFVNNLRGGPQQGASTITQQYAKQYYTVHAQNYLGKLKQAILAIKLDRAQNKDEILGRYLNTIYFGRGAYGIQAAAQAYFGVDAKDMTVSEAAMLAGIIPAPSIWDPAVDLPQATARWNRTLDRMVSGGWLTAAERATQTFPPVIEYKTSETYKGPTGYLLQMVKNELTTKGGLTEDQLNTAGLNIVTTIDANAEKDAIAAVDALPPGKDPHTMIALVSIDPSNGAIRALYGGADYLARARNAVTQDAAQAGSTFKPFTLITALEQGIPLTTTFNGRSPQNVPGFGKVPNFANEQFGNIDLVKATAHSVNTVYAQLNVKVGPDNTAKTAEAAGITTKVGTNPANVLGTDTVHPLDLASAYATIASGGYRTTPHIVDTATFISDGTVAYKGGSAPKKVFDAGVIADTTYAMEQVVQNGTASGSVKRLGFPVAGKTGTTDKNVSGWFVGFTAGPTDPAANKLQLSTAVAMYQVGDDGSEQSITGWGGVKEVTGGTWPAFVWSKFMGAVMTGKAAVAFPPRANVGTPAPTQASTATSVPTPTSAPTTAAPTSATVPTGLVGKLRADAEAAVLAAGLQPSTTEKSDPTIPVGTVLSASPAAGTVLPRGSTVSLVVSSGPAPKPTSTSVPTAPATTAAKKLVTLPTTAP